MLIAGVGYLLGNRLSIDARSVGRVLFYFFSPVLIFNLLYTNQLPLGEILQTMASVIFFPKKIINKFKNLYSKISGDKC